MHTLEHLEEGRPLNNRSHSHRQSARREMPRIFNTHVMAFLQTEKAFDSVETSTILKALQNLGIDNAYRRIFRLLQ